MSKAIEAKNSRQELIKTVEMVSNSLLDHPELYWLAVAVFKVFSDPDAEADRRVLEEEYNRTRTTPGYSLYNERVMGLLRRYAQIYKQKYENDQ